MTPDPSSACGPGAAAAPRPTHGWEPPVSLGDSHCPPWPDGVFPAVLDDLIAETSRATQTPPDFPALLALAALSVAWAGKVCAEIYPGYQEPLMLYAIIAAQSGERKSAVFDVIAAPLRDDDGALGAAVLVDDATPEALEELMVDSGGKAAVFGPEGGAFLDCLVARRRGLGSALFLKGHTGEPHRTRRVARGDLCIDRPALTVGLMTQPAVLRGLLWRHELATRGLLGRLLFSCPDPRPGGSLQPRRDPVPAAVRLAYERLLRRAVAVPLGARVLPFSAAAQAEYERYFTAIEERRRPGRDLAARAEWVPKLRGNVMRIAALLHLADVGEEPEPWRTPVSGDAVRRAAVLGEYLLAHARLAYGLMSEDDGAAQARRLRDWLRQGRRSRFTAREAQRHLARVGSRQKVLDPALRVLLAHGYIRGGRRGTSEVYEVNPYEAQNWPETSAG